MVFVAVKSLSYFSAQHGNAVLADAAALVTDKVAHTVAKNASILILTKNNAVTLDVDLKGILLRNIQGTPHLYGKDDATQLVNLAHYSSGLHYSSLPPIVI